MVRNKPLAGHGEGSNDAVRLAHQHMTLCESSWNVGTFGAIAEFHQDAEETKELRKTEVGGSLTTERGAMRMAADTDVQILAYEGLSASPDRWTHGVGFCLPLEDAGMEINDVLLELGPDKNAIREEDRHAILFDIGIGAPHVQFCIRTNDPGLLALLRGSVGESIVAAGNPVMGAIIEASPHRVAVSRLGRTEVFQHIGSIERDLPTPLGPHTHVLPDLVRRRRTHSANIPMPSGFVSSFNLFPANPLTDEIGDSKPFDSAHHSAFQNLLLRYGPANYMSEKQRVTQSVLQGDRPEDYVESSSRLGRTGARIALRQMVHTHGESDVLTAWQEMFDRTGATDLHVDDH